LALLEIDDLITSNLDICQFSVDAIRQIEEPTSLQQCYEQLQQMTILDPTCGAGAFLFAAMETLAIMYEACLESMQAISSADEFQTILTKVRQCPNQRFFILRSIIEHNLYGVDIMEEAVELCLLRLSLQLIAEIERAEDLALLPQIDHHIHVGNALSNMSLSGKDGSCSVDGISEDRAFDWQRTFQEVLHNGGFGVIIGNPPYGRVALTAAQRRYFARGLFGHANLYGLFTDIAMRWTKPAGVIAYVTPTSFLAGEYFKRLRSLLAAEAPPLAADFVHARKGVFEDVLQETLLATYRKGGEVNGTDVHHLDVASDSSARVTHAGRFIVPPDPAAPWLVPRVSDHQGMIDRLSRFISHRLPIRGGQPTKLVSARLLGRNAGRSCWAHCQ